MIRTYLQPQRLDEALGLVAKGAVPVAGATGLFSGKPRLEGDLVDISRLGLNAISVEPGRVVLGATATLSQVLETPIPGMEGALLRRVAGSVASRQMRNAITLGGNLAHVAYWADFPVALLALEANVEVQRAGEPPVIVSIRDCLAGKRPWEDGLITRFIIPLRDGICGFGHERFSRTVNDYSLATACATLKRDGQVARSVTLVLGALQARPFRVPQAEQLLEGQAFTSELLDKAARAVRESVQVAPNFRASADYRRELAGTLARRALHTAFSWAMREN